MKKRIAPLLLHCLCALFSLPIFAQTTTEKIYLTDSRTADTLGMWAAMQTLAQGMEAQDILINGKLPTLVAAETYRDLAVLEVIYIGFDAIKDITDEHGKVPDSIAVDTRYNYDGTAVRRLHKGILVCHKTVVSDLKQVFEKMLRDGFPVEKVQPANLFSKAANAADGWDDEEIMQNNVTTCFNFRVKTNRTALSLHAEGKAIDINPKLNPYESYSERGKFVHPVGAIYEKNKAGAVNDDNIVHYFDELGWQWAGRWTNPVDYQHFQKNKRSKKAFLVGDADFKNNFWIDDATDDFYLYKNKRAKELNQPYCIIYKNERPLLEQLFYALDEQNLSILLQQKAKNHFDALPEITWDYQITDRNGKVFNKNTLLQSATYLPILPKNNAAAQPLKDVRIALYTWQTDSLIWVLAKKLKAAGANVLTIQNDNLENTLLTDSIFRFNPHCTLALDTHYSDTPNDTDGLLLQLGNFTRGDNEMERLAFMRLLLTNDFEKSQRLANAFAPYFNKKIATLSSKSDKSVAMATLDSLAYAAVTEASLAVADTASTMQYPTKLSRHTAKGSSRIQEKSIYNDENKTYFTAGREYYNCILSELLLVNSALIVVSKDYNLSFDAMLNNCYQGILDYVKQ